MPRLTQTQLTGFRIGAELPPDTPPPDQARSQRRERTRTSQATPPAPPPVPERVASHHSVDEHGALGPVPPAPASTEPRTKLGLALPLELAERTRALTRQGFALADLVMVAYQDHRDQLVADQDTTTARRLVVRPQGRSPVTIALSHAERDALDTLAERLGWTRSRTVAALLERQLESMSPIAPPPHHRNDSGDPT